MKNFKLIVSLAILVVMGNTYAATTVLQKKIAAVVDKIAKNPNIELTADEKTLLSKHLNDNDANINRLKSIKDFDMSQLTQITAATVEQQAPQTATVQKKVAPVKKAAPAKPLTAAQKRAAARREAAAAQLNPTPTKAPVNTAVEQKNNDIAPIFYDAKTNSLKIDGVREFVEITRKAHPDMGNAQLIAKTYQNAVAILKPIVNPLVPAAITTFDALCRKLMTMIEDVVTKPLPSAEERSFALLYDAKTKALKADGVREFVAITRTTNPTMSNAQLIQKTYDDAVAILKATLNPLVPAAIKIFDALCVKLMTTIKTVINKPLPPLPNKQEKPLPATPQAPEPVVNIKELEERLAKMEAELYYDELKERMAAIEAEIYYDKKTGLITNDGIKNIIEIIKHSAPTINNKELIAAAYDKAAELLKEIKKQPTLDKATKDGLIRIITHAANQSLITTAKLQPQELGRGRLVHKEVVTEPFERRARIGESPDAPIFVAPLKELETISMSEHHEEIPKSISYTVPERMPKDTLQFIDKSKQQGIVAKTMDETWMLDAIGHILYGKLTKENKQLTLKKLLEIADAVVGEPLRKNMEISDDEYTRIVSIIEQRINNFMKKLYVGAEYYPSQQ